MSVKLLQKAEAQLALAHQDLKSGNPTKAVMDAAQEHVRRSLLLVREALADMVAPRPPRMGRRERG